MSKHETIRISTESTDAINQLIRKASKQELAMLAREQTDLPAEVHLAIVQRNAKLAARKLILCQEELSTTVQHTLLEVDDKYIIRYMARRHDLDYSVQLRVFELGNREIKKNLVLNQADLEPSLHQWALKRYGIQQVLFK